MRARNLTLTEKSGLPLSPGRFVKISVADACCGVPAEWVGKIFDPYFTTKPTSSGLGLAMCYSIVKKHSGFLHLESNSAAGATFAFYLPMACARVVSDAPEPEPEEYQSNHQRILVMDDEAAIRELTSQLLATMGYEVTAVPDGAEALCIYESAARKGELFEGVILDATVARRPRWSGDDRAPAGDRSEGEAIICSGYSDAAAIAQFLSYGFRGALPKPFTRGELASALEKALSRSEQPEMADLACR